MSMGFKMSDHLNRLRVDLAARFPERKEVIDGALAAILAGGHCCSSARPARRSPRSLGRRPPPPVLTGSCAVCPLGAPGSGLGVGRGARWRHRGPRRPGREWRRSPWPLPRPAGPSAAQGRLAPRAGPGSALGACGVSGRWRPAGGEPLEPCRRARATGWLETVMQNMTVSVVLW